MSKMWKKMAVAATIAAGLAACATRATVPVTPAQRAMAVTLVLEGGTVVELAACLGMSPDDARRVVRATARELMRWLPRSYEEQRSTLARAPAAAPPELCASAPR